MIAITFLSGLGSCAYNLCLNAITYIPKLLFFSINIEKLGYLLPCYIGSTYITISLQISLTSSMKELKIALVISKPNYRGLKSGGNSTTISF